MRDGIKDKNDLATAHFYTMRPCAEFGLRKLADTLQNKCFYKLTEHTISNSARSANRQQKCLQVHDNRFISALLTSCVAPRRLGCQQGTARICC